MVIVVEGKNDANKIKSVLNDVDVIITNGSEINTNTLNDIKKATLNDDVVLCLDPDGPGEKIRRIIMDYVDGVHHVFAERTKAISHNKRKVGIEHMSNDDIKEMFKNIKFNKKDNCVTFNELFDLGYMTSKEKRIELCKRLGISYCNGKQLLKRINMFGITMEEILKHDCR